MADGGNDFTEASPRATGGRPATEMPLSGVRVLEFGRYAAGPFGTLQLADWGAEVVKIEPPGGEDLREWPPQVQGADGFYSLNFASINRNKRSVVADLRTEVDRRRIQQLIEKADVILENYRPGAMDRLGFGFDDAIKINPRVVYTSVSGYGHFGPKFGKGAFDIAIQGASGMMSVTGEEGGPPIKSGVPFGDFATAVFAALACVVGLRWVDKTGKGCRMDVPMLSCMLSCAALQTSEYWGTGVAPRRLGSAHPRNAPYQAFRAGDGKYFIIAAGNTGLFHKTCDVLAVPALKTDPRFLTANDRAMNQKVLEQLVETALATKPATAWRELLDAVGVPTAPVYDYPEALVDPQVIAANLIHEMSLPGGGTTPTVGNPVRMNGYEFEVYQRPAVPGEHNDIVAQEWLGDASGW